MKLVIPQAVPTHIISGFLGAGKTTLLQQLLLQKPKHEVWAVLMNEFGQIGIDQQILPNESGYEVKELLGGCMCCSSQLPLHIALARLLSETKPDRLFIEPTGLGHPAQLLEQLSEPHWHSSIQMRALITVLDGSRLHDQAWVEQHLYQDQLKAAQLVVVSHHDQMTHADEQALEQLQQEYAPYAQTWFEVSNGILALAAIDRPSLAAVKRMQPLLVQQQRNIEIKQAPQEIKQLPYHYVESNGEYSVAGWKFSRHWQFDFDDLFDLLSSLEGWLRIKAIFHTNQGWITFNFNPAQLNYKTGQANTDNRIEIITPLSQDWLAFEQALLACRCNEDDQE